MDAHNPIPKKCRYQSGLVSGLVASPYPNLHTSQRPTYPSSLDVLSPCPKPDDRRHV